MGYKSRGNWLVDIEFCKKCHKVTKHCVCGGGRSGEILSEVSNGNDSGDVYDLPSVKKYRDLGILT